MFVVFLLLVDEVGAAEICVGSCETKIMSNSLNNALLLLCLKRLKIQISVCVWNKIQSDIKA